MARRSHPLIRYTGYARFAVETFILRRKRPYLFILVINDQCNLNCFYCASKNTGQYNLRDPAVRAALSAAFDRGHRALVITGGEPMLWQDGPTRIHDVVAYAYSLGFHDIAIFTNGTHPLDIPDVTWIVTVDGTRAAHNAIRANSYDLIMSHVRHAQAKVLAAITLSKANADTLEAAVEEIAGLRLFHGITFNLLTHNPAVVAQHGFLGEERARLLDRVWALKQQGYPIVLSKAAYRAMKNNDWQRPVQQIELLAGNRVFTCCRDVDNPDVCRHCGYSSCVEISQALRGKPSAIFELLKAT
jgi:MoaA/NifB/PqqE/SkfB family radical SAM enzyme